MGGNNGQRTNFSTCNGEFTLFGIFVRTDYRYKDRYLLTGIIYRGDVPRFSESNRYGVFPFISAGRRMPEKAFTESNRDWLDGLEIRANYGVTGNLEIPVATNFANLFTTDTSYTGCDMIGANNNKTIGFRLSTYDNTNTK